MSKFYTKSRHYGLPGIEFAIENVSSLPTTYLTKGRIVLLLSDLHVYYYDGSQWVDISGGISNVTGTSPVNVTVTGGVADISVDLATPSSDGLMPAADKALLDTATATGTANALVQRDSSGNAEFNLVSLISSPTLDTHATTKLYVDNAINAAIAGLDWQADVKNIQTDASLNPGTSPTTGDRYIITNPSNLHANFGTITGLGTNDIVEYDGSAWVVTYDVSAQGSGALVNVEALGMVYRYDGTAWNPFTPLESFIAGAGLTKNGSIVDIVAADNSITVNADSIQVNVDNSTIETDSVAGLRVKAGGITASHINSSALGTGIGGGNGTALFVENYTPVSGTTVARKYVTTLALTGNDTPDTITHNLNTMDIVVQCYDTADDTWFIADVKPLTNNTCSVSVTRTGITAKIVVIG